MRKLAGAIATAIAVMATPSLARDKAWYIEADAGVALSPEHAVRLTGADGRLSSKAGYDLGVASGYDLGKVRIETEASVRRSNFSELLGNPGFGGIVAGARFADATLRGHRDVLSLMLNGLLDFGPDDGTHFLLGGGVGVARVREAFVAGNIPRYGALKTGFAWQGIAAVSTPVDRNWDVGLKYRYFDASGPDRFVDDKARVLHDHYQSHSVLVTLTYNFVPAAVAAAAVVPPPAPPAPPPPPPPPPAPPQVCSKGPYIVFFDWNKATITSEAATILDGAVQAYASCGSVPVMLAGYADRSGAPKYNLGLSARRDAAVQKYLVSKGIPASSITSQAFGETNPRVPTPDGVRELQNRRVEITYGPGSGN